MEISQRVSSINESITLKLNAQANAMAAEGKEIFNLTAGQLPFRPIAEFIGYIRSESDFVKSFQYSPVAGFPDLRKKIVAHYQETRGVDFSTAGVKFDCAISNGAKHSLSNVLGCLLNPDDEAMILAPYWISYPEMIKFCRATPVMVSSNPYDVFTPSIDEIESKITNKTKLIILNSPNNPSGIHYSEEWMRSFAEMLKKYPKLIVVCDEIYYHLNYYDPKPTFFYQFDPSLLAQTVIVDGISKVLASTGLRIGWTIAPQELIDALVRLQGQTTSGANSLVQRALNSFDFNQIPAYLEPIKKHLRENAEELGNQLRDFGFTHVWYQPLSAFYYLLDFAQFPILEKMRSSGGSEDMDYSVEICEKLLLEEGIALVPGGPFGVKNSARISLVSDKPVFKEAVNKLMAFLTN
jgi:aspartate aminotransferase